MDCLTEKTGIIAGQKTATIAGYLKGQARHQLADLLSRKGSACILCKK